MTKLFLILLLFICGCISKDNDISYSQQSEGNYNLDYNFDSLQSEVIYNRDTAAYNRIVKIETISGDNEKDFFISQCLCYDGNAVACLNCYGLYSYFVQNKDKYLDSNHYFKDSLMMNYYLLKSFEIDSSISINIVRRRFKQRKIPKSYEIITSSNIGRSPTGLR